MWSNVKVKLYAGLNERAKSIDVNKVTSYSSRPSSIPIHRNTLSSEIITYLAFKGDKCCERASICVGHRVCRHNTTLKFLWIFTFMQRQSHVYIPYSLFSGTFYFFLMFQSYTELKNYNSPIRISKHVFKIFHFQS